MPPMRCRLAPFARPAAAVLFLWLAMGADVLASDDAWEAEVDRRLIGQTQQCAPRGGASQPLPPCPMGGHSAPFYDRFAPDQLIPRDSPAAEGPGGLQPTPEVPLSPQEQIGAPLPLGGGANLFAAAAAPRLITPNMIGDFFGTASGTAVLPRFACRAVLHTTSINDFHCITGTGDNAQFLGGPGSREFFVRPNPGGPFGPAEPVQFEEGLVRGPEFFLEGRAVGNFIAHRTDETVTIAGEGLFDVPVYQIYDVGNPIVLDVPSPSAGPGVTVGRQKIADNTSPMPRDRVFFNYSYFDNVPLAAGGVNVNRFTPGLEKTFFDGLYSFEARFPFATTLDSNILLDGITNDDGVEFGNVVLYNKLLLHSTPTFALSAGLGITLPTADDLTVSRAEGPRLVEIENESVHLLPFLGALWAPTDRFFVQGFVQFDLDANGNTVLVNSFRNGLVEAGRANDAAFTYVDLGVGYWLYRTEHPGRRLTGVVPMFELHYNRSLEGADVIQSGPFVIGNFASDVQVINATIGTTFLMGRDTTLQVAYGTPIGNSTDHVFDGEMRINLNWYFGGTRREDVSPLSFVPAF